MPVRRGYVHLLISNQCSARHAARTRRHPIFPANSVRDIILTEQRGTRGLHMAFSDARNERDRAETGKNSGNHGGGAKAAESRNREAMTKGRSSAPQGNDVTATKKRADALGVTTDRY